MPSLEEKRKLNYLIKKKKTMATVYRNEKIQRTNIDKGVLNLWPHRKSRVHSRMQMKEEDWTTEDWTTDAAEEDAAEDEQSHGPRMPFIHIVDVVHDVVLVVE